MYSAIFCLAVAERISVRVPDGGGNRASRRNSGGRDDPGRAAHQCCFIDIACIGDQRSRQACGASIVYRQDGFSCGRSISDNSSQLCGGSLLLSGADNTAVHFINILPRKERSIVMKGSKADVGVGEEHMKWWRRLLRLESDGLETTGHRISVLGRE